MNFDKGSPAKNHNPKPWPMIWIVIAILSYILFQLVYILWKD
ncbi:MAG: hypothetical protein DF168_00846 [Candidatus Moanabacter tarae]|uniref:Uncharacterized protein n=1 Tax=Candidatus Moanibacter tarae TaxID=2200854 RepID=A0A2Z4AC46_9BACT|nr:MAG: hypothetical protein DF168_00846 [Candidatus Moanabacter tarae]